MVKHRTTIELIAVLFLMLFLLYISAQFNTQETTASIENEAAFYGIDITTESDNKIEALNQANEVDDENAFFWGIQKGIFQYE